MRYPAPSHAPIAGQVWGRGRSVTTSCCCCACPPWPPSSCCSPWPPPGAGLTASSTPPPPPSSASSSSAYPRPYFCEHGNTCQPQYNFCSQAFLLFVPRPQKWKRVAEMSSSAERVYRDAVVPRRGRVRAPLPVRWVTSASASASGRPPHSPRHPDPRRSPHPDRADAPAAPRPRHQPALRVCGAE